MGDEVVMDGGPIRSAVAKTARLGWSRDALRLIDQPVVNRIERQLEAVGDAEFVEDVVQMVLDGLLGDEKLFADFLVTEALRD